MGEHFDVITMGRVGVDFYPTTTGSLVDVQYFEKFLGGSPTNVAVAAARLGDRTAVVTRTGPDPFGEFVHVALRRYGVDDRFVRDVPGFQTPVTFCELFPPDHFPIHFYRAPKAPDLEIFPEELDLGAISAATLFWATVSGLSVEPSRSSTLKALASRERRHPTVLDLDFRPIFWSSNRAAREAMGEALRHATVAVGNLVEVDVAIDSADPDIAADRLLELGLETAVIKMGPEGVLAKSRTERVEIPPVPTEVVNGLGAGDAFGGAFCHGMLAEWSLDAVVRYANAAGAIVAGRLGCSDAMPTKEEIEKSLEGASRA
ncbi:MAG: 5-dehydro-2-deoxygluconokinase [Acidimicrobiales bacterium]